MRILAVEDGLCEQDEAVCAIRAAGHEAVVTDNIQEAIGLIPEVDAVITDMFFTPQKGSPDNLANYRLTQPPMGLTMIILAMSNAKPVVVCTDSNHHSRELSFIFDGFISELYQVANEAAKANGARWLDYDKWAERELPFGWVENKDWKRAVEIAEIRARLE